MSGKSRTLVVAAALAAAGITTPVLTESFSPYYNDGGSWAGRENGDAFLNVSRVGTTGTVAVYSASLVQKTSPTSLVTRRPGAPTQAAANTIQTQIDYVAFSNNNWIVIRNGVVLTYAAVPAADDEFKVTDVGGKALITVGTVAADGNGDFDIEYVTVRTLLADGANGSVRKDLSDAAQDGEEVVGSVVWAQATGGSVDSTEITLETSGVS